MLSAEITRNYLSHITNRILCRQHDILENILYYLAKQLAINSLENLILSTDNKRTRFRTIKNILFTKSHKLEQLSKNSRASQKFKANHSPNNYRK